MKRLAVINVVGLTERLLGGPTPRLGEFRARGRLTRIAPAFPAVTCTAQANYLTGRMPAQHGIVGNGWYNRELAEVQFWRQSNQLVQAPKLWEHVRKTGVAGGAQRTAANLFWWFNMYSTVDYAVTPRPIYRADGGKIFDVYSWPYSLRKELRRELGEFPFFGFWGPAAGVKTPRGPAAAATCWIAEAAKWVESKHAPALQLIYLPHLDYNLQRLGPYDATDGGQRLNPAIVPDLRAVDDIVGGLIRFFDLRGVAVAVLSEYGITPVDQPVHLNRIFREQGWLTVKDELGGEVLDAGASRVFAVADHQVAHVYLNDARLEGAVRAVLAKTPGVEAVLGAKEQAAAGLRHPRAGDLVAVAAERAWFTYYYWLDDRRAPDFARTVDIHRKPGYDPAELFLDPRLTAPKLRIAWRLLQKRLGFRMLMDVIPLDATLVKGSHGRRPADARDWPVLLAGAADVKETIDSTDVFGVLGGIMKGTD